MNNQIDSGNANYYKMFLCKQFTESSYFISNSPIGQDSISEYNGQVIDCATEIGEGITRSAMFPRRRYSFCHSNKEYSFVIDPNGLLYRCWDVIGIEEYAIGDLSYEGQITVEGLKWLCDSLDDKCKECSLLPLCMGGCPFEKRIKGENICAGIKESTLSNLKIAFKQYQNKKQGEKRAV
ncbi:MAG: SPASM domain-containing protein [Lachnospiraceae bacterium]|nr:SPASM domain-containing protein [Lachnospiraceae bacterium]